VGVGGHMHAWMKRGVGVGVVCVCVCGGGGGDVCIAGGREAGAFVAIAQERGLGLADRFRHSSMASSFSCENTTTTKNTHRELKKRILGMRGEEWGRIVVDGAERRHIHTRQQPIDRLIG
jgi:hypothetical protein